MATVAFSADSHVVEPPEVFSGLQERFGDRAPRIEHEEDLGDFILIPAGGGRINADTGGVGRLGIAGRRLDDPKTHEQIRRGYAGLRQGVLDPAERLKDQDLDGVGLEVLYPSVFFRIFGLQDIEIVTACFRNYNDWMRSYCSESPMRLLGLALLPMQDPESAAVELDRVIKLGFRGGCIPCTAPGGRPYHDTAYDPVWARAEEAGFPLSMHIFTGAHGGASGLSGLDPITSYASAATIIQLTFTDLICQGVAHRFPGLRFVSSEFNTGWIANWLERLDHSLYRSRSAAPDYLDLTPSEYWRRQFYATFEDDRHGILTRDTIGTNTLMWGNDFPHHDAVWPNSQRVLDEVFEGVPEEVRRETTVLNVARLYGVPPTD